MFPEILMLLIPAQSDIDSIPNTLCENENVTDHDDDLICTVLVCSDVTLPPVVAVPVNKDPLLLENDILRRTNMLTNNLYDILSKIQRFLPALGVFYLALAQIWGLPFGDEINMTIAAIATLLGTALEISTGIYLKNKEFNDEMQGGKGDE